MAQGNTLGVEVVQDSGWKWLQFVMGRLANFDYCFDVEGQRPGLAPAGEVLSGFVRTGGPAESTQRYDSAERYPAELAPLLRRSAQTCCRRFDFLCGDTPVLRLA